ncbi:hypothetical protein SCP_0305690 [Sparassis crispa]|uniref:Uncharacterized protein n=1 Tax=Sparassis crispa TaxID=139825 RepID=A0A401GFB3_9APHY|nr:hypothetical protein SCP_0305690 [Sparassis crispa]GBE80849.1 hypothetical protein SCP_0305690 [Sparassis crispa]
MGRLGLLVTERELPKPFILAVWDALSGSQALEGGFEDGYLGADLSAVRFDLFALPEEVHSEGSDGHGVEDVGQVPGGGHLWRPD